MKTTTRVQLELPQSAMERLQTLKQQTESASYSEVMKNALKVYQRMLDLTQSGHVVFVRDKKGQTTQLELLI